MCKHLFTNECFFFRNLDCIIIFMHFKCNTGVSGCRCNIQYFSLSCSKLVIQYSNNNNQTKKYLIISTFMFFVLVFSWHTSSDSRLSYQAFIILPHHSQVTLHRNLSFLLQLQQPSSTARALYL